MLKHLLVALDDTRDSRVALQHALDLAHAQGGRVLLATVKEGEIPEPDFTVDAGTGLDFTGEASRPGVWYEEETRDEEGQNGGRRQAGAPVLEEARTLCEQYGILGGTSVLIGRPADRLSRKLRVADALIVGRGGSTREGAASLGSCTRDLTRNARKPLLVAGHEYFEPDGVLAIYDGTEAGQRTLQLTGELGVTLNRHLSVLCCGRDRDDQHRLEAESREYLRGYGFTSHLQRVAADDFGEILTAAREANAATIAVPRSEGLMRWLRPTLAERLIEELRFPIWVVG
jgi:nucleotide-binding universal stress UspA family protein